VKELQTQDDFSSIKPGEREPRINMNVITRKKKKNPNPEGICREQGFTRLAQNTIPMSYFWTPHCV
jgi:hypothetical protein